MFVHTCTACERRQLFTTSRVTDVHNTDHGIEVHFTCWCDAEQVMLTGRKAPAALAVLAA